MVGMKGSRLASLTVFLAAMVAGPSCVTATPRPAPAGWAVVVEYNSYAGRYSDLPVGYVNSARIVTALVRRGWPPDHILLVRDSQDRAVLRHSVGWLASRVRPGDVALLYIAGEYQFFDGELTWGATFPRVWKQLSTSHRVLIVETCFAERLTAAVTGIPGLGLPAVGRDELDWWGLRDTGRLLRGGTFTYFLARALESQPVDIPPDFAAAFVTAVAGAQAYFRTVISTTPGALGSFHARGSYPERMTAFPNPHLIREIGAPAAAEQATGDP
jgi:hypothetical protein